MNSIRYLLAIEQSPSFQQPTPLFVRSPCSVSPCNRCVWATLNTRYGLMWNLHIGGQVIQTTAEHPFYVKGRGWVRCDGLQVGDLLMTEQGHWLPVEDLLDTGEWMALYNFRVAEFHTYFVGTEEWGFSVWTHNACVSIYKAPQRGQGARQLASGYGAADFIAGGNNRLYFAKDRWIADSYAFNYGEGVIEIQIDEKEYNANLKMYESVYVGNNIHTGKDQAGTELEVPASALPTINKGTRIWHK